MSPIIWPAESAKVSLFDVNGNSSGSIVASGYAQKSSGEVAYFIALLDANGRTAAMIQTNPFIPHHVCLEADGTVWSFGKPNGSDINPSNAPEDQKGYLRQYSFQSGVISEYFSRVDFGKESVPSLWLPPYEVSLHCDSEFIGIWSGKTSEWIEVDPRTKDISRLKWQNTDRVEVRNVVSTDDGEVYTALVKIGRSSGKATEERLGLFQLQRNRVSKTAKWEALGSADQDATQATLLVGTDGTNLVHLRKDQPGMFWSTPK